MPPLVVDEDEPGPAGSVGLVGRSGVSSGDVPIPGRAVEPDLPPIPPAPVEDDPMPAPPVEPSPVLLLPLPPMLPVEPGAVEPGAVEPAPFEVPVTLATPEPIPELIPGEPIPEPRPDEPLLEEVPAMAPRSPM